MVKGPLYEAYKKRLQSAEREDSPDGQLVLYLADQLDNAESDTAAGRAALAGRLQVAARDAFAGAPLEPDKLDELTAKRRKRYGA